MENSNSNKVINKMLKSQDELTLKLKSTRFEDKGLDCLKSLFIFLPNVLV